MRTWVAVEEQMVGRDSLKLVEAEAEQEVLGCSILVWEVLGVLV